MPISDKAIESRENNQRDSNNLFISSGQFSEKIKESISHQNIQNINCQQRKVRSNSCVDSMKSSMMDFTQKNIQNSLAIDNGIFSQEYKGQVTVEIYQFIKSNIDKNILNEFDTFQEKQDYLSNDLYQKNLLQNIKQLIEIYILQSKVSESELKEKHEQECDSYNKNLQRLEAQIRDHIRIQQELKLYLESSQIKCQEQAEQIKTLEKMHLQQTDFLEKVCDQMQQQLEIKDNLIKDLKSTISELQVELVNLKGSHSTSCIPQNKLKSDFNHSSKQINNLSNCRIQTDNQSFGDLKQLTPAQLQKQIFNQIQTTQTLCDDKENNIIQANQLQFSHYCSQLKQPIKDDISSENIIQNIIQKQKLQNSSFKSQQNKQNIQNADISELSQRSNNQQKIITVKKEQTVGAKQTKEKRKFNIMLDSEKQMQNQFSTTDRQFSAIQGQNQIKIFQKIKSNQNIESQINQNQSEISNGQQKFSFIQSEPINCFEERMTQVSKKIKEYIKDQCENGKNNGNNVINKQNLMNKLKYMSKKNSRVSSIANHNNLVQYFYDKFEDKLEKNLSQKINMKQKVKSMKQMNDKRCYENHKTEENEREQKVQEIKRKQRQNRSNSFNIGSQSQNNSSNQYMNKISQAEKKFAKQLKNQIVHTIQSSHNNINSIGVTSNQCNFNQIGDLNANNSNISNFNMNDSYINWNKRSGLKQSENKNISYQFEGVQKQLTHNNYIDASSDSIENFIQDNFILTNNSTENLKTLEL